MKPIIGITCSYKEEKHWVYDSYKEVIEASGGIPIFLPVTLDGGILVALEKLIDGLVLTGGGDVNPLLFGESPRKELGQVTPERDFFELNFCRLLLSKKKPILGICRGLQILNVAVGGTLYQDLATQLPSGIQHNQRAPKNHLSHDIYIKEKSHLHYLLNTTYLRVNSFHHQSVKSIGNGFEPVAWSEDGVIEGIESKQGFAIGVQWHPERLWKKDKSQKRLFLSLVEMSKRNS